MRLRALAAAAVLAPALASPAAPARAGDDPAAFRVPVKEGSLSNGMKVLVVERHEIPVVSCVVKFRVGSADEASGQTGIAHILEHMLFKGTDSWGTKDYAAEKPLLDRTEALYQQILAARAALPLDLRRDTETCDAVLRVSHALAVAEGREKDPARAEALRREAEPLLARGAEVRRIFDLEKQFIEVQEEAERFVVDDEDWAILDRNGAVGLNASTGQDSTQYYYSLPANRLELWALIESGRMRNPVLRQFYKERDVIMEERRMRIDNSPAGLLNERLECLAFDAHPYSWPVIGWASDISVVSRTQVEQFFHVHYAPNRAVAAVVGDVRFEDVVRLMERYFGDIPRQPDPPPVVTVEPSQRGERRAVVEYPGLEIPEIAVAYHRPALGHPDFYALDVMGGILNEGNTARLRMDLFLRGRIGQVRAGNGDSLHPGLFEFSGRPLPGKTLDDVEKGIEDEVRRLREEPVSEKELRRIRTQNAAGLIRSMESNLGLAQILSSYEVLYRWDYIHTYGERVAGITAEDIQRVARKYFTPENRVVVRLVPAAGAADKPKEPGK